MVFLILDYIEHIIADGFEVISLSKSVLDRFHLIIRLFEGEETAKHLHNRFF